MNKPKILLNFNLSNKFLNSFYYSLLPALIGIFLLPNLAFLASISGEKIIELTNKERLKNGLEIVTANQLLEKAAHEKGRAIFTSQTFQHNIDDRKFSSWIKDAGYKYFYAGENLAIDFVTNEGTIEAWLKSPTHKKNILNENFREIGVAILEGQFQGNNTTIIVQIFGSPLPKTVIINPVISKPTAPFKQELSAAPANNLLAQQPSKTLFYDNSNNYLPAEALLTHSTKISLNNFNQYRAINKFQYLKNYKLINDNLKKINTNYFLGLGKINLTNNNLIPNYLLLLVFIFTSALLLIIYLYNKKINQNYSR